MTAATTAEGLEKVAQLEDALSKDERKRRFIEVKLAREKAQRHLETLVKKKREKEDEVGEMFGETFLSCSRRA